MSEDIFETFEPHKDDISSITGLCGDYVNVLGIMANQISMNKLYLSTDSNKTKKYIKSNLILLTELSNLPRFEQRYLKKNNPQLYSKKSLPYIVKLNNLVDNFNNRSKDFTLNDLEISINEIYFAVHGEHKKK